MTRALRQASPPATGRDPATAAADVTRLLRAARLLRLGVTADATPLFLAVGLRELGHDARLVLGREYAPREGPASYYQWVRVGDRVVSTAEPVGEVFQPVVALPSDGPQEEGGAGWTPRS